MLQSADDWNCDVLYEACMYNFSCILGGVSKINRPLNIGCDQFAFLFAISIFAITFHYLPTNFRQYLYLVHVINKICLLIFWNIAIEKFKIVGEKWNCEKSKVKNWRQKVKVVRKTKKGKCIPLLLQHRSSPPTVVKRPNHYMSTPSTEACNDDYDMIT